MSAKQKTAIKKESFKATLLKEISTQLSMALPALKENLGEKKFDKRIKKAAKLLSEGIKDKQSKKDIVSVPVDKIKVSKLKVASSAKKPLKDTPAKSST